MDIINGASHHWCRHEIVGYVTQVGPSVKDFKVGDRVGVGCMVDSCQQKDCDACGTKHEEQFCAKSVQTYNMKDHEGNVTYGGYSTHLVVSKKYALYTPSHILAAASLSIGTWHAYQKVAQRAQCTHACTCTAKPTSKQF